MGPTGAETPVRVVNETTRSGSRVRIMRASAWLRTVTSPGPGGVLLRRLALPAVVAQLLLGLVVTRVSAAPADVSTPVAVMVAAMVAVSLFLLVVAAATLDHAHQDAEASRARAQSLVEQAPD